MTRHRPIVGALHIGFGILAFLPVVILSVIFGGIWGIATIGMHGDKDAVLASTVLGVGLGVVLMIVACSVALFGLLSVIGGIGVLKSQRWGDYMVLVASLLHFFQVPLGTALAVYTAWALFDREPAAVSRGAPVPDHAYAEFS